MKIKLFQNFSTPDIFTELTGFFPTPNMTCEEFKAKVDEWLDYIDDNLVVLSKAIRDGEHNMVYYAMLTYRQVTRTTDYCYPNGNTIPIDELPLLEVAHMLRDTLCWMLDLTKKEIKPLTPEQQDLWLEKSGNRFWCYEKGNTWCD